MQTEQFIDFKKERDLGSIITDAFKFIRLEWKELFKLVLTYIAIPMVLVILSFSYYMFSIGNISSIKSINAYFLIPILLLVVCSVLAFTLMNLSGIYYIKSYVDNNGKVQKEEVHQNIKKNFLKFLGYGIISTFIMVVSVFFCFFPVFYTMTALTVGTSLLVFQNKSAIDAVSSCFGFVNKNFWPTLGTILVVSFLISILGMVFKVPVTIYQIIKTGLVSSSEDPDAALRIFKDPIYLILNALSLVANYLFYVLTLITNVFLYFDINEKINATGSIEKIETLGE